MRKLYPYFLFIFPLTAAAQKNVDLDPFRFKVQYRSLPSVKIDSTYHTYNVEVEGTKLMSPLLNELEPEKSVRLEGWKKLPQSGHLDIKIKLGDLLPGDMSVKERVVTTKNGNGVVTGTKIFYSQEVVYSFEAAATVTDYKGEHIKDLQLADRSYKRTYRSPEFSIRAIAEGYFLVNSLAVTKELYRDNVNEAIHYLSERLTEDFGYNEVTVNDNMWVIGSRKHPEYSDWRNAFQQMNEVLFDMTASSPIKGAREHLKPVIDYFEKIKTTYSSTSRHDRKIRYASYYNLAVLYYYLDDPQAMMKEANGLILNDFDGKDGKAFATTATWLRNLFEQTNIYTRHFSIDINSYKGPYENGDVTSSN
jgi:hypothetical protein